MPLSFFAQPPFKCVDEFLCVGGWTRHPTVADFPLLVPAAFVNGLLDAADVFVVADRGEARFPERAAWLRPAGNQFHAAREIILGGGPQAERTLRLVERRGFAFELRGGIVGG